MDLYKLPKTTAVIIPDCLCISEGLKKGISWWERYKMTGLATYGKKNISSFMLTSYSASRFLIVVPSTIRSSMSWPLPYVVVRYLLNGDEDKCSQMSLCKIKDGVKARGGKWWAPTWEQTWCFLFFQHQIHQKQWWTGSSLEPSCPCRLCRLQQWNKHRGHRFM